MKLVDQEMVSMGQFVVTTGSPPGTVGSTNLLRVHRRGTDDTV
jgi:pyruvate kinase